MLIALCVYLYVFCCIQSLVIVSTLRMPKTGFALLWRVALAPILIPLTTLATIVKGR